MKANPYVNAPRLPEGAELDLSQLIGVGRNCVELEIGSGRGGFIFERLANVADLAIIGLEIRRKWATLVDERLKETGLGERARVFAEDARQALRRFPNSCLAAVFVHFPDPWWKKRHQKRLVVSPMLVEQLVRVLRIGGFFFLQTDVLERAEVYEQMVALEPRLQPVEQSARVAGNPFFAQSPRERRAQQDGLPVYRLLYHRCE